MDVSGRPWPKLSCRTPCRRSRCCQVPGQVAVPISSWSCRLPLAVVGQRKHTPPAHHTHHPQPSPFQQRQRRCRQTQAQGRAEKRDGSLLAGAGLASLDLDSKAKPPAHSHRRLLSPSSPCSPGFACKVERRRSGLFRSLSSFLAHDPSLALTLIHFVRTLSSSSINALIPFYSSYASGLLASPACWPVAASQSESSCRISYPLLLLHCLSFALPAVITPPSVHSTRAHSTYSQHTCLLGQMY